MPSFSPPFDRKGVNLNNWASVGIAVTSGLDETMQSEGIDKGFLVLSMGFTRNWSNDECGP